MNSDFEVLRRKMVDEQIIRRGITDRRVVDAMQKIPRHKFVPAKDVNVAYIDSPVPIGYGQTISQPYMVALMTQVLRLTKKDAVLEIGTGSGYQTAVLAELCSEVFSIERVGELAQRAEAVLKMLEHHNVHIRTGDGTLGWGENILFDGIIVTAAAPSLLDTLTGQLKNGGRMVVPIGNRLSQ